MIAGLLGEHLASPRTATKTNQNTALETNRDSDNAQSNEDGFAAYVAKDSDAVSVEPPQAEEAIAASQTTAVLSEVSTESALLDSAKGEIAPTDTPEVSATATDPIKSDRVQAEIAAPDAKIEGGVARQAAEERVAEDPRLQVARGSEDTPKQPTHESKITLSSAASVEAGEAANISFTEPRQASNLIDPTNAETGDSDLPRAARAEHVLDGKTLAEADIRTRTAASDMTRTDLTVTPTMSREAPAFSADPTVTIGLASSAPTATVQTNMGLTPTPAAIPVAAPNDLTSVILNAVKNGADPQEQLVVQLDPPELGRVMIDFKFDAQGVQQITITSENPEALKRLRELHFELTQALRENGLSDQNMSFRQEAQDQSNNAWQNQDQQRSNAPLIAADDRRASPSVLPAQPTIQARDRLDLLL